MLRINQKDRLEYLSSSMPTTSTKELCTSTATKSKQPASTSPELQIFSINKDKMWVGLIIHRLNFWRIIRDLSLTIFFSIITKSNTTLLSAIFYRKSTQKLTKFYLRSSTVFLRAMSKTNIKSFSDCSTFKFKTNRLRVSLKNKLKYCHSLCRKDCVQTSLKYCYLYRPPCVQEYFSVFLTSKNQTLYQNFRIKF